MRKRSDWNPLSFAWQLERIPSSVSCFWPLHPKEKQNRFRSGGAEVVEERRHSCYIFSKKLWSWGKMPAFLNCSRERHDPVFHTRLNDTSRVIHECSLEVGGLAVCFFRLCNSGFNFFLNNNQSESQILSDIVARYNFTWLNIFSHDVVCFFFQFRTGYIMCTIKWRYFNTGHLLAQSPPCSLSAGLPQTQYH